MARGFKSTTSKARAAARLCRRDLQQEDEPMRDGPAVGEVLSVDEAGARNRPRGS